MSVLTNLDRSVNAIADKCQTAAWALLRILASAMFLTHGWPKMFGENAQRFWAVWGFRH